MLPLNRLTRLILFGCLLSATGVMAQQPGLNADSLYFRELMRKADTIYQRKSYDSAFKVYEKAYALAKQKDLLSYYSASNCLLFMGHCFLNQFRFTAAHPYYYAALLNARQYSHHAVVKYFALRNLHLLHYNLQIRDSAFSYPERQAGAIQKVAYDVNRVLFQEKDSAVVEIFGGTYDGLVTAKNTSGDVFALADKKEKKEYRYAGTAVLLEAGRNKSIVSLKLKEGEVVQNLWQVRMNTELPDNLSGAGFEEDYISNINWRDSEGDLDLFNRRFYRYYYDNDLDDDITGLLKEELKKVVTKFAPDTLNPDHFVAKTIEDGIFKGKNIVRGLQESNGASIHYFLGYVMQYKTAYVGMNFKFADAYATWVVNKSPMTKNDARKFILGDEKYSDEMIRKAKLVYREAEENNWPDSWIDEALQQADKNYLRSLLSYSRLLYHYGKANNREEYIGWSNYLDALRQKVFGRMDRCDSFLHLAYAKFSELKFTEGMQWVRSTRQSVIDTMAIRINIQTGHLMPYDIYISPNQRYFATGGDDFTIKIWDITLGKEIHTIEGHNASINDMAYNPGGRYLASLSEDSTIKVWNTFNYGLMNEFKPPAKQKKIDFTPDGKYIITAAYDSTVNFWDPFTGKLVRHFRAPGGFVRQFSFNPKNPNGIYLTCTDSTLYYYDLKTAKAERIFKSKEIITGFYISRDARFAAFYQSDSTVTILDMEKSSFVYRHYVFHWNDGNSTYLSHGDFSPDSRYFVFCDRDSTTAFLELDRLKTIYYNGYPAKQFLFNSDGTYYIKQEPSSPPVIGYFADFSPDNPYQSLSGTTYESYINPVADIKFTSDNKSLIYLTASLQQLDLATGRTTALVPYSEWTTGQHLFPENDDLIPYRAAKVNDTLSLYSRSKRKTVASLSMPGGESIASFSFFEKDTKCLLTGTTGGLACWDVSQQKLVYSMPLATGYRAKLSGVFPLPDGKRFIIYGNRFRPYVMELATGRVIDSIDIPSPGWMAVTGNTIFFASDSARLYFADPVTYKVSEPVKINTSGQYLKGIETSRDGRFLYILDESTCYIMETATRRIIREFTAQGKNFCMMALSPDDKTLAISSFNGQIVLYEGFTGKLLSRIYTPLVNDAIVTDSMGHYIASKQALQAVVFSYGGKAYNYDQFDLQLNQPHRVLKEIGRADTTILQAYENAYRKRLKRNGVTGDPALQSKLPVIILLNRQSIKPATTQEFVDIRMECFDNTDNLAGIRISVNDVPLQDNAGAWARLDTSDITVTIRVPLITGNNKVKMYCVNQAGVSSLKEMINITCNAKEQKQQTWFIGIGVNTYSDASMNLVYSAKDIRDLAASFKKIYPGIIIDTLINKQVTLANITKLEQRLKKIRVTDRVIMAVTGHGLLSDSLDFYYATYDVDFNNPAGKGLKYEALENLLNQTAARQKLLLIDACHSGMLDKEELLAVKEEESEKKDEGTVKVKDARGFGRASKSKLDASGSFDLMQNLFADLSSENGIVVISAAGGLEYAFESKQWNNGVFTYCVRKAIEDMDADKTSEGGNGDRHVSVQELMRYVSKKVPALTKDRQQPTSRRENIDFDWRVR